MSAAEADKPLTLAQARALFEPFANEEVVVIAVSGGPDSTALALACRAMARVAQERAASCRVLALTVDHGLRKESAREARAVKALARKLGVAHRTLRWKGDKPATGLQEAARNARYALLAAAAAKAGARYLLTAHTLDDQAETVLLRLLRGSGPAGPAGDGVDVALSGCGLADAGASAARNPEGAADRDRRCGRHRLCRRSRPIAIRATPVRACAR